MISLKTKERKIECFVERLPNLPITGILRKRFDRFHQLHPVCVKKTG
jgi:hypothetical protein